MITRRDLLLTMIAIGDGSVEGRTRLTKLMYIVKVKLLELVNDLRHFLLRKKIREILDKYYEFKMHYYGPYSEELIKDLKILENEGFITSEIVPLYDFYQYKYTVTDKGRRRAEDVIKELPDEILELFKWVKKKYGKAPLTLLLHDVYRTFRKIELKYTKKRRSF